LLNSLKKFFEQSTKDVNPSDQDLYLLCGLMVEASNIDGHVDQKEIDKISKVLIEVFLEDPKLVEEELTRCINQLDEAKSLHFFTSKINKSFSEEKKFTLITILWEIILEDGKIHDFESNLIRRLAGLLYISDAECGIAKEKAIKNNKTI
tara:strand:+ start:102 stop:551 length:450 start_codon:yes stop_codon:yes gene_type:complete